MTLDATQVRVAGAGHVFVAPVGTALPTSLAPLAAPWVDLGYISKDGAPQFTFGRETTDLEAWQSGDAIRVLQTKMPKNVTFTLMQSNPDIFALAFGGGDFDTDTSDVTTYTPPAEGVVDERALVIEFFDGDITFRYCVKRTTLQGNVQFSLNREAATAFPLDLKFLAAAAPAWKVVMDDPAFVQP